MPSGAKKRKALKKKKQQGAIGTTSTDNKGSNGDKLHEHISGPYERGSQDDRESDSTLSSPGSQGNEDFGRKDPSPVEGSTKEISADAGVTQGLGLQSGSAIEVERGMDDKKYTVENSKTPKTVACQDACGDSVTEIAPAVDSVKPVVSASGVVVSEKSEHVETSSHSNLAKQMSEKNEEYPSPGLEKDNCKVVTLPGSAAAGTSKKVESARESEVPVSSEEQRPLLPGPPAVRTSWLSCCGLFEAMTGSDR